MMITDAQQQAPTSLPGPGPAVRTRCRLADAELRRRTLEGSHLPSVEQLLRGFPFASGEIAKDSVEFARELLAWCAALEDPSVAERIRPALVRLLDGPTPRAVQGLADAVGPDAGTQQHPELLGALLRCRVYLAHLGSEKAALAVALDAVRIAYFQDWEAEGDGADVVWQSLGWLLRTAYLRASRQGGGNVEPGGIATAVVQRTATEFEARIRRCVAETSPLPEPASSTSGQQFAETETRSALLSPNGVVQSRGSSIRRGD